MKSFEIPKIKGVDDPKTNEGIEDYFEEKQNKNINEEMYSNESFYCERSAEGLTQAFSSFVEDYEQYNENNYEKISIEIEEAIKDMLLMGKFTEIIEFGKNILAEFSEANYLDKLDEKKSGDAILITEAINLSAKISSGAFYMAKPAMIVASAKIGAKIGVENHGGMSLYYLFDRETGVASFHDPGDGVAKLLDWIGVDKIENWEFEWSGVYRQDLAYNMISEKERFFLQRMRYNTLPGENSEEKKKLFDEIDEKYSI